MEGRRHLSFVFCSQLSTFNYQRLKLVTRHMPATPKSNEGGSPVTSEFP